MAGEETGKADEIGLNIKKKKVFHQLRCLITYATFVELFCKVSD